MIPHVLGIGYPCEEYLKTSVDWAMYGLEFDYVDDIKHAIAMLLFKEYVCIVICADTIFQEDLDALRKIRPVPIVVVPPSYTEDERFACVHFGAAQYLRTIDYPPMIPDVTNSNSLQNCLKLTQDQRKPLTIITVQDLSICMESRSVEIKGKEIKLTETEFDILSLLVMNQKQVFTYEMIMESVWESDYEFYSRNAISSHISNLRRKLQASSDVAEHTSPIFCTLALIPRLSSILPDMKTVRQLWTFAPR